MTAINMCRRPGKWSRGIPPHGEKCGPVKPVFHCRSLGGCLSDAHLTVPTIKEILNGEEDRAWQLVHHTSDVILSCISA